MYRHMRKDTKYPFYIGIGTKPKKYSTFQKEYSRAHTKHKRSDFWKKITDKYEYYVEIMFESDDYEIIKQKEIEFINLYGRKDLQQGILVNLTDGGDGNVNLLVSEETRKKLSKANKGRKFTQEQMESIQPTRIKAETHPNSKLVLDTQTGIFYYCVREAAEALGRCKNRLSDMLRGKTSNKTNLIYVNDEPIETYEISEKGYKYRKPKEVRERISQSGRLRYKDKVNPTAKKVINTETGEIFPSSIEAAKVSGYSLDYFRSKLNTKSPTVNNTLFKYI